MPDENETAEYHIPIEDENRTAVEVLAQNSGLSRQVVKKAMKNGAVWITRSDSVQRIRRATKALKCGDQLHFYFNRAVIEEVPTPPVLVSDEGDYSVWDKPYGLRSQGSKWGDHCTIARWVEMHHKPQRPTFIVHRLDRAATGLIVVAHTKRAAADLARQYRNRSVKKSYRVVVAGHFPESDAPKVFNSDIDGKTAKSTVRSVCYQHDTDRSVLEVSIETGRKHQIRKHLSGGGFPVIGDRLYGSSSQTEDLMLRACYLEFDCPTTNKRKAFTLDH